MKIIDLLNKIANGEEVPKFWWNGCIHEVQKEYGTNKYSIFDTYCKKYKKIELEDLNEEIKFLEEEKKIPERVPNAEVFEVPKLNNMELSNIALTNKADIKLIKETLNEVLDYLKSKGDK